MGLAALDLWAAGYGAADAAGHGCFPGVACPFRKLS